MVIHLYVFSRVCTYIFGQFIYGHRQRMWRKIRLSFLELNVNIHLNCYDVRFPMFKNVYRVPEPAHIKFHNYVQARLL